MTQLLTRPTTLATLEAVIERGFSTFVEVGNALKAINDGWLFREDGYATFADYVKRRWGWERSSAYAYVNAAEVAREVAVQISGHLTYSQASALVPLSGEERRRVVAAVDFATISYPQLRAIVQGVRQNGTAKPETTTVAPSFVPRYQLLDRGLDEFDLGDEAALFPDLMVLRAPVASYHAYFVAGLFLRNGGSLLVEGSDVLPVDEGEEPHHHAILGIVSDAEREDTELRLLQHLTLVRWYVKGTYADKYVKDVASSLDDFIERLTRENDTVCEPLATDATVALAALKRRRKYVGANPDPRVLDMIRESIEKGMM